MGRCRGTKNGELWSLDSWMWVTSTAAAKIDNIDVNGFKKIHNQKQNKNLSQNFKTSKGQLGGNVNSSADACSSAGNIEIFTHICVRRSWTAAAPPASMTSGSHADTFQWEFSKDSPSSSPSLQEEWQHLEISWGDATKWPCGSAVDQLESRTCLSVPSSEPAPCF